jgi:hypothetical protein
MTTGLSDDKGADVVGIQDDPFEDFHHFVDIDANNAGTHSRCLHLEVDTKFRRGDGDLFVCSPTTNVMEKETNSCTTSCARDGGHHGRFDLFDHSSQVEDFRESTEE